MTQPSVSHPAQTTRLTYTGSLNTLSLPDPDNPAGEPLFEAIVYPGWTDELPAHPIVDAWRARGLLVEPAVEPAPAEVEPSPEDDSARAAAVARKVRQQRAQPGEPQE